MTAHWIWFLPLALATVLGALLAFRYGWIAATLTESDVIDTMSRRYVTEDGGARQSDCTGLPGQVRGAWITVRCGALSYHVNRFGGVISTEPVRERPAI
ncbi:hypothetical protein [Marivita sp. GX14005]|uniref:hypothetical protein n=1 Tax=Marivita sp. GX14005 TaxID=2942276 RepID=UPI00201A1420|nr:hypothetical protein [Marivita sp. GX14005]MCL3882778.1 hypothetical protein [Marivita sp. GX14005]